MMRELAAKYAKRSTVRLGLKVFLALAFFKDGYAIVWRGLENLHAWNPDILNSLSHGGGLALMLGISIALTYAGYRIVSPVVDYACGGD
jgi:hypothetical protein